MVRLNLPRTAATFFALCLAVTAFAAAFLASGPLQAQQRARVYPPEGYNLIFRILYDGEYKDAFEGFRAASRGGIRTIDGEWIDGICYHTMMGECYYQLGDLPTALTEYDTALKLFVAHKEWMLRVDFPPAIEPSSSGLPATIVWAKSGRGTTIGNYPSKSLISQGRINNDNVIKNGGVVSPPEYRQVQAIEIARCTALAIRRRNEIMGPAAEHDPFTNSLLAALESRPAPPGHWSQSLISAQLGMAYIGAGKIPQGTAELQKGITVGGKLDHPLTGAVLLELGKISFKEGKYDTAAQLFIEASMSAAAFNNLDDATEAFRWGQITHIVTGKPGIYPPLKAAADWSRTSRGGNALSAMLYLLGGENAVIQGDTSSGAAFLAAASKQIGRRDMANGRIGAYANYVTALMEFQRGDLRDGQTALASMLTFQRNGSSRLFQIGLADKLFTSGSVTPRVADLLYADVLRDPTNADWATDPMESLSVLAASYPLALEHWFEVTLERKEPEKALEIADRLRRHRFFMTLSMGGRLEGLRWVLTGSEKALPEEVKLRRRDLLAKYPKLGQIAAELTATQKAIEALPLAGAERREEESLYKKLAQLITAQELILHELALRREPCPLMFPELLTVDQIQERMQEGQLALAFLATQRGMYGFAISKDRYGTWKFNNPIKLRKDMVTIFKDWGQFDRNATINPEDLRKEDWQGPAKEVYAEVCNGMDDAAWETFDELILVPDSFLWYLPFSALPVQDGERSVPIAAKARVRYAPFISMVGGDMQPHKPTLRTALISKAMTPREDKELAENVAEDIQGTLDDVTRLPDALPAPGSLVSKQIGRLIVFDDIAEDHGPYDWSPLRDGDRPGNLLVDWLTSPVAAPEQIMLPGYHTAAANGLKEDANGDEIFLPLCAMLASGSRNVLISRWRVGGQSTVDLIREYSQELPHTSACNAWQRSVELLRSSKLDSALEPRIKSGRGEEVVNGSHPFFWSGYIVVDQAVTPK